MKIGPMGRVGLILLVASGIAFADTVEVYFSPVGGCTQAVVGEVQKAKREIVFEAYNFTSPEILAALKSAIKRGVSVRAIYDRSQKDDARTLADDLGVPRVYGRHKIMHNKVIVIDGKTVLTGSFNFTTNAERFNSENLVVIRGVKTARKYLANFLKL